MNTDPQDPLDKNDDIEQNYEAEPDEETNWLLIILSIPKVGEFLAFCIAVAPLFVLAVLFFAAGDAFGFDTDDDEYGTYLVIAAVIPTFFWLTFLENKARIRLCLPIPIVNIPIKWILIPLLLLSVALALGFEF